jgi:hypothetical protein
MLQSPTKTNAAFLALLSALDAEIIELQASGQMRFHEEAMPQSARILSHAAINRSALRDEVAQLYSKWSTKIPAPPATATLPMSPRGSLQVNARPVANAMPHNDAAKRLGVSAEKLRGWLEGGLLKGTQLTRTKWKVDAQDLLAFARDHRALLQK